MKKMKTITIDGVTYEIVDEVSRNTKQDKLISGENIKTINGESIVGEGNIVITGGGEAPNLDTYLTEDEAEELYQPKGNYLTEHQPLKTINGIPLIGEGDISIVGGETVNKDQYVNLEYLESVGAQYIDTGYIVDENDVIEVTFEIPQSSLGIGDDKIILDARDNDNGIRVSTYGNNGKWYARFGSNAGFASNAVNVLKGTFSISKNKFILNGSVISSTMAFIAMPTGSLVLFSGLNRETITMSGPSYVRIKEVKIKNNGETVKHFVGRLRVADDTVGMLDKISGDFFANEGTGDFLYKLAPTNNTSGESSRKPVLTDEQKQALQALMDDYYNNKGTFYYEFTHNRNAFSAGSTCYTSSKSKFKLCCATFVQNIMMGRSVNDYVGKTSSTYSPTITRTAVSDFGYYFDFKYRKYLYGLTDTDSDGNTIYYGYNQPNEDNFEGSYSYNSYYHPDSKNENKQNFNGFCNANDMARELYEMGCEVPFSELDIGDIIFTLDNDLSDNTSMLNFHAWRNIYHVGMVYDVKQIDASSKEIYYIECTSYFDVDNRPIEKPFLSSEQMDLRFKAFKLTEDMAFCARMPIAFGYESNVPNKITNSATPS